MFDGTIRTIGEVRHVNDLKKNLLSLGQIDSHWCKTHVENGIMKIVKGAFVLMKAEKIGVNLFMIKGETLQEADACVASNREESMMMWHLKLGHMLEQCLKILSERKLLPGLKSVSLPFCEHCVTSIQRQFTVAYTPQQNGVAERMNRTLTERKRAMLMTAGLPNSFWAEAAKTACYIVNRSPSTAIGLKTAMEMWTEKPNDYSYLHAFGCPVYDPTAHKIVISRDVIFIEDQLQVRDKDDSSVKEKPETIPVYKIKRDGNDQMERYRARLVVKGYAQKEGIDFNEIFSPVVQLTTVRVVLAMCAIFDLHLEQLDVKTVFFLGELEEDIYMLQPKGPNKDRIEELKAQLAREFEMKDLGPTNKILGMQIHRNRNNRKIWLSQKNYLKKILWRFNINEAERKEMSRVPYASAVGSLMFAMICTRPDIAQSVGAASRYMANPGGEHWIAVKRILRYIRGTSDVALCYGGLEFTVKDYVDSDFAGDLDKIKSTTGYMFTLAGAAVSWVSKLQTVVALSTAEAEYMTATQACKEAIWIQRLLEELVHKQEKISVFCDSQSALHIAKNPAFHSRTKHIGVQYHFVREVVEDGSVDLQKIHTKENLSDVLTKPINADKFICSRSSCGLAET
ncbi:Integrase catalytic domain-containing protein [Citrus sinensis]|nr:Integrase catalytic domain-containing protein [Citrus sinensis]